MLALDAEKAATFLGAMPEEKASAAATGISKGRESRQSEEFLIFTVPSP